MFLAAGKIKTAASAGGGSIVWGAAAEFTLSGGNRIATYNNTAGFNHVLSSTTKSSGKWYVEMTLNPLSSEDEIGFSVAGYGEGFYTGFDAFGWGWYSGGGVYHSSSSVLAGSTWNAGDTIMLALDAGTGKMWWGKTGTWLNSGNPGAGTGQQYTGTGGSAFSINANCKDTGSSVLTLKSTLTYSVPSGFSAW